MNPMEFQHQYRSAISLFATGVTVLLTERAGDVIGMTANGVTSLSMEPTQLIVCPAKPIRFAGFLAPNVDFTVNILSDQQEAQSNYFACCPEATFRAGATHDDPPFELLPWPEAGRVPRLSGCLASIGCRVHEILEGGDHWIVVGNVLALHQARSRLWPLLYYGGQYHHPSKLLEKHLKPDFDPYGS